MNLSESQWSLGASEIKSLFEINYKLDFWYLALQESLEKLWTFTGSFKNYIKENNRTVFDLFSQIINVVKIWINI